MKETKALTKRERVEIITRELTRLYPEVRCALDFENGIQLLVATRLSAQCTDKRVNIVTKDLFKKYRTVSDFASADRAELEEIIKPCGFFREKAKSIIGFSRAIIERFGGELPDSMEELVSLPGVGRKTANLIMGEYFGREAYICDTHCIRLSNRLGLTESKNPEIVEKDLRECVPPEGSMYFCHRFVTHGREVCKSQKPLCGVCPLAGICLYAAGNEGGKA